MSEINLAPSGAKKLKSAAKKINLVFLVVSIIVIVGVFTAYLFIYFKNKNTMNERGSLQEVVSKLDVTNKELDQETLTFKEQIKNTDILLRNHVYFSNVLDDIEQTAIPLIWYSKIEANIDENKFTLSGKSFDLSSISKQLANFSNDKNLTAVNVRGAIKKNDKKEDNAYEFSVETSYQDNFITGGKK